MNKAETSYREYLQARIDVVQARIDTAERDPGTLLSELTPLYDERETLEEMLEEFDRTFNSHEGSKVHESEK